MAKTQTAAIEPDEITLEDDGQGNRYLPGAEETADRELADAAGLYQSIKTDRVKLTGQETEAKDQLKEVAKRKRDLFQKDPDNSNALIYKAGGILIRIKEHEDITTEILKPKKEKNEP